MLNKNNFFIQLRFLGLMGEPNPFVTIAGLLPANINFDLACLLKTE
jgi:hypothetical protein